MYVEPWSSGTLSANGLKADDFDILSVRLIDPSKVKQSY